MPPGTDHAAQKTHPLYCCERIFTAPLLKNRSIRYRRNVFSDPLPSNGHGADHTVTLLAIPFLLLRGVFRALPRSGSTCHNIYIYIYILRWSICLINFAVELKFINLYKRNTIYSFTQVAIIVFSSHV
jgi:hypothetical protein